MAPKEKRRRTDKGRRFQRGTMPTKRIVDIFRQNRREKERGWALRLSFLERWVFWCVCVCVLSLIVVDSVDVGCWAAERSPPTTEPPTGKKGALRMLYLCVVEQKRAARALSMANHRAFQYIVTCFFSYQSKNSEKHFSSHSFSFQTQRFKKKKKRKEKERREVILDILQSWRSVRFIFFCPLVCLTTWLFLRIGTEAFR